MLIRRPSRIGGTDRLTLGLAAGAVATAGTVLIGQVARMARRRQAAASADAGVIETAEHALEAATQATQDTVTVAIEGYAAAPKRETVLFNILSGFSGGFALMRFSTPGASAAAGGRWATCGVGGRHVHHFVPGILTRVRWPAAPDSSPRASGSSRSSRCRSAPGSA